MRKEVIIIDDHKIFGEGFCSLLEKINIRVKRVYQSPKKALIYLKENKIDIVFCDINMPEIDGIELIKKIKQSQNDIKIIMVSMYNEKNINDRAILYEGEMIIDSSPKKGTSVTVKFLFSFD